MSAKREVIKFEPSALEKFKSLSSDQWWRAFGRQGAYYYTVDHEKYADMIFNLARMKRASDWAIGRFVVELQKQLQKEFNEWDKKYYKDPAKKPEYTSPEKWFNDHYDQTRLSWRQAKRHQWVYLNVDPNYSDLGYKKNRAIEDYIGDDEDVKKRFRQLVRDKQLSETEVEKTLEIYIDELQAAARDQGMTGKAYDRKVKDSVLKKIEQITDLKLKDEIEIKKIIAEGCDVVIKCSRVKDAARIRDTIISMEEQIKLKAYKRK